MRLRLTAGPVGSLPLFLISSLSISGSAFAQNTKEPDRKAIVIGINCYNPEDANRPDCERLKEVPQDHSAMRFGTLAGGEWLYWHYPNLNGAVSDATMMKAILESRGFTVPKDAFLLDGQATA